MKKEAIKPGDQVSFLNEKQEGIVKEILENGQIIVDLEDGFPVEVSPRELVVVKSHAENVSGKVPQEGADKAQRQEYHQYPILLALADVLYFLTVPLENTVSSGPLNWYLVNSTCFQFAFTIHYRKNGLLQGHQCGIITPGQCIPMGEFKREDLFSQGEIQFDALLFDKNPHNAIPRIHKTTNLDLPVLSQSFPSLSSPLCFSKASIIYTYTSQDTMDESGLLEKLKTEFTATPSSSNKDAHKILKKTRESDVLNKYGLSPGRKEVDLHIEELRENIEKLSNSEMLQIQMEHFRKELDNAILRRLPSVVFIHGIGNGKLKNEIRGELQKNGFRYADAAYHQYGSGATEVFI